MFLAFYQGVTKEQTEMVKPRLAKSAALTSLQAAVNKENPKAGKKAAKVTEEPKEKVPVAPFSPMDVSTGGEAFSRQMLPPNVNDIDSEDKDNPQLVSEYVNDIYDYMRQLETR